VLKQAMWVHSCVSEASVSGRAKREDQSLKVAKALSLKNRVCSERVAACITVVVVVVVVRSCLAAAPAPAWLQLMVISVVFSFGH